MATIIFNGSASVLSFLWNGRLISWYPFKWLVIISFVIIPKLCLNTLNLFCDLVAFGLLKDFGCLLCEGHLYVLSVCSLFCLHTILCRLLLFNWFPYHSLQSTNYVCVYVVEVLFLLLWLLCFSRCLPRSLFFFPVIDLHFAGAYFNFILTCLLFFSEAISSYLKEDIWILCRPKCGPNPNELLSIPPHS